MKKGLIFLNGDPPSAEILGKLDYSACVVLCADGAYNYLSGYCKPDLLLGDFDSVTKEFEGVRTKRFPVDKDYTDGHLVLIEMAQLGVKEVEIYGAFGGRPDHEYANFALLALADSLGLNAVLRGDYDVYFVKDYIEVSTQKNKTVSIVPYTDTAHIISSEGLKFDASSLTMNKLHMIGVSNTATAEVVKLKVGSGSVLLFVERR